LAVVLGIDAAWTARHASGVAVVAGEAGQWRLVTVADSYADFYRQAGLDGLEAGFDAGQLLEAAAVVAENRVDLIAADIPLAHSPIVGRRESDNAVSRLYGGRHAGTHTPSVERPGALADRMRADFMAKGYPLLVAAPAVRGLIEVYPHPALIELATAPQRLRYKVGKIGTYWKALPVVERRDRLLAEWRSIVALLDRRMAGSAALLPLPDAGAPVRVLKAYEDMLDAVVCGWIGSCVLEGKAMALGDADSAIWVPVLPAV